MLVLFKLELCISFFTPLICVMSCCFFFFSLSFWVGDGISTSFCLSAITKKKKKIGFSVPHASENPCVSMRTPVCQWKPNAIFKTTSNGLSWIAHLRKGYPSTISLDLQDNPVIGDLIFKAANWSPEELNHLFKNDRWNSIPGLLFAGWFGGIALKHFQGVTSTFICKFLITCLCI